MRRPEPSDGFTMCFQLSLLWECGWLVAAIVLLALHFTIALSPVWWRLAMTAWVVVALAKTCLIEFAAKAATEDDPKRENKNPYSVKDTSRDPEQ